MSNKNIIGWCVVGSAFIWFLADTGVDFYEQIGWWTLVATPISVAFLIALWAFVNWLLD